MIPLLLGEKDMLYVCNKERARGAFLGFNCHFCYSRYFMKTNLVERYMFCFYYKYYLSYVHTSLRSHQVPFAGTFPGKRDFPRQSHSVDARRDFSRWSHQTCWVRGRKSDLELVIDIAQLFSSNVRMRELWWHGELMHSRFAQQKPLNCDCPRKAGAFDDSVDGQS